MEPEQDRLLRRAEKRCDSLSALQHAWLQSRRYRSFQNRNVARWSHTTIVTHRYLADSACSIYPRSGYGYQVGGNRARLVHLRISGLSFLSIQHLRQRFTGCHYLGSRFESKQTNTALAAENISICESVERLLFPAATCSTLPSVPGSVWVRVEDWFGPQRPY